jgi:hypothetical protein
MLRPLFDQKSRKDGHVSPELRRSLVWWLQVWRVGAGVWLLGVAFAVMFQVLSMNLAELRPWGQVASQTVHLFGDAAGNPPHLGAVLCIDGEWFWSHADAPVEVLASFRRRRDNQIMGLELLSISLGFETFSEKLRGRKVVVHSDNTGSEASIRRGSARSNDHAQLVHSQWLKAAVLSLTLFIKRVATDDNIADLPSRLVCIVACPWCLHALAARVCR